MGPYEETKWESFPILRIIFMVIVLKIFGHYPNPNIALTIWVIIIKTLLRSFLMIDARKFSNFCTSKFHHIRISNYFQEPSGLNTMGISGKSRSGKLFI